MKNDPMDPPSTNKILDGIVPKGIKDELSAFLEDGKATAKSNKHSNDKKSGKKKMQRKKAARIAKRAADKAAAKKRSAESMQQSVPAGVFFLTISSKD